VLYIIKENRTYDQIFGDLPQGNDDPELTIFGREVTPNHHAIAERWVLLDNTYCNGVLSADGHQWTNEGEVADYLEKAFGGFVRSDPFAGGDALAYAPSGFIWDYALGAGLDFRIYGEFVSAEIEPDFSPYTALPNQIPLDEMNPAVVSLSGLQRYYAEQSMAMPLDDIDEADEDLFNRVIWHSVKGYDVPYAVTSPDVSTGREASGREGV